MPRANSKCTKNFQPESIKFFTLRISRSSVAVVLGEENDDPVCGEAFANPSNVVPAEGSRASAYQMNGMRRYLVRAAY
jgi:hypothetical protein